MLPNMKKGGSVTELTALALLTYGATATNMRTNSSVSKDRPKAKNCRAVFLRAIWNNSMELFHIQKGTKSSHSQQINGTPKIARHPFIYEIKNVAGSTVRFYDIKILQYS